MARSTSEASSKRRKTKEKDKEKKHGAHPLDQRKSKGKEKGSRDLLLLPGSSNWQNLPSDLLQSIFDRVSSSPSIPDILSFSAVCTSWRSLAKSSPQPLFPPRPLLFSPFNDELINPDRSSISLLNIQDPRTYRSLIPKSALDRHCCGCSYGHLIFASSSNSPVFIADIFSPAMFRLPNPPQGSGRFTHGVLTAPLSSSSCMLLLINSSKVLCWRSGADPRRDDWLVIRRPRAATLFKKKLLIMYTDGTIFALKLNYHMQWKQFPVAPSKEQATYKRLTECNGELLMLYFVETSIKLRYRIEVYMWDFSEYDWVRIESIGDWCLFMDFVGRCPLACRNPGKWGGESNCIYFTGPWFGPQRRRWTMLPMNGTEFEHEFKFHPSYTDQWPSSAWVYPSASQDDTKLNIKALISSWESRDFTEMHDSESEAESEDFTETDDSETKHEDFIETYASETDDSETEHKDFIETDDSETEHGNFTETDDLETERADFIETEHGNFTETDDSETERKDFIETDDSETEHRNFTETDGSETEHGNFTETDDSETEHGNFTETDGSEMDD